MFLAVGQYGVRLVSDDGIAWKHETRGREADIYRGAAFGHGRFVAVGTYGGDNIFAASEIGDPWQTSTQVNRYATRVGGVAFANDAFMAIGGDPGAVGDSRPVVMFSGDGVTWTEPLQIAGKNILRRVVFGGGLWVGVGDRGQRARSADGRTWEVAPNVKAIDTLVDVTYGAGLFVGVGLHGLRMVSRDGLEWTDRQLGLEGEHLNSILWTGERFAAVGAGGTYLSADGTNWTREANENAPLTATFGGGVFIGAAWRGRILHSTDAIHWRQVFKSPHHFEALAYGQPAKSG
jgi:hypothetical protein